MALGQGVVNDGEEEAGSVTESNKPPAEYITTACNYSVPPPVREITVSEPPRKKRKMGEVFIPGIENTTEWTAPSTDHSYACSAALQSPLHTVPIKQQTEMTAADIQHLLDENKRLKEALADKKLLAEQLSWQRYLSQIPA